MLDLHSRRAIANGIAVDLSPAEFATLHVLVTRRGVPMSREAIGALLDQPVPAVMIDVYIKRTRAKLAAAGAPCAIQTVWGRGYMAGGADDLDPAEPPTARHVEMALAPAG